MNRRPLVIALAAIIPCMAGAPARAEEVDEESLVAREVGFARDARKAKRRAAGSDDSCADCSLFKRRLSGPLGTCRLFDGALVPATGWCSEHQF